MKKAIRHLRRQSHEVRTSILYILSILSFAILFALWLHKFQTDISNSVVRPEDKQNFSPFSVLKDNFVGGINSLKESTPW